MHVFLEETEREHGHSAACCVVTVGCTAVCLQSVLGQALTLLSYSSVWL